MTHKGFTLIELMITITIFSLIMMGLYPIFTQISTFNSENYIRTLLIDNLRLSMDRLTREIRESIDIDDDGVGDGFPDSTNVSEIYEIYFEQVDPDNPSETKWIKYTLTSGSYSISTFPNGKQLTRYVKDPVTGTWSPGNPVSEPVIKYIEFKRSGQMIKICIISEVKLRTKGPSMEYLFLSNVALRNYPPSDIIP